MKCPENESGDHVAAVAAMNAPSQAKPDCLSEIVNRLRQRARFYFNRYQRTGDHLDIRRATMMQAALIGLLEARRP